MSKKYHISKDGTPRECRATVKGCSLGLSSGEHYDSREAAQKAFENSQKNVPEKVSKMPSSNANDIPDREDMFEIYKAVKNGEGISRNDYNKLVELHNNPVTYEESLTNF